MTRKVSRKYSKSSEFYFKVKGDYFENNSVHKNKAISQNQLYAQQPRRLKCKCCSEVLPKTIDIHQHGIDYVFCTECNHMNGVHEDTINFVEAIYLNSDGEMYANEYYDENYLSRVYDIYLPKVKFLTDTLGRKAKSVLDIGCGSGYFVMGCHECGIDAFGIDVGKNQIDYGNSKIKDKFQLEPLVCVHEGDFINFVKNTEANVISAIGVIEHLRQPELFFEAFKLSNAEYLFYSVPMFSFSVLLENILQNVFPRQLFGDHTHLFTEKSLSKMNEIIGVTPISEWRFGADALDLYRFMLINLKHNGGSEKLLGYFERELKEKLDGIQAVFDKGHFCSEIHVIAQKK